MSEKNGATLFLEADISENQLWSIDEKMFRLLLIDHTLQDYDQRQAKKAETDGRPYKEIPHNIFWATADYEYLGDGYKYYDQITPELITGERDQIVMPRVLKSKEQQRLRSKEMAEVFTPSWVCNAQNNLVDEAWFGKKGVFNEEIEFSDGTHSWNTNPEHIAFPNGKTWRDYVCDTRLEITCGEAPYLVSRYDTTTGEMIPLENRIGIIDRKLRVINENVDNESDWVSAAKVAYMSTYGYEWQGDNLLLAREAMLATFIENFQMKFGKMPAVYHQLDTIAYIISWNLWQMDGMKMVIPDSCHEVPVQGTNDLFGEPTMEQCPGCKNGTTTGHNGHLCLIRDWEILYKHTPDKPLTGKKGKKIPFLHVLNLKK